MLIILLVMVWTGSSLEKTKSLMLLPNATDEPDCGFAIVEKDSSGEPAIRVRVPFPKYSKSQEPVPDAYASTPFLLLPDPANLVGLLKLFVDLPWIAKQRTNLATEPGDLGATAHLCVFLKPLGYYREQLNALLKAWDPTGRLTLTKVASTLHGRIM